MTNMEALIAILNDEVDDGEASREAWIHYHIACPYIYTDRRCLCAPDDFREGKTNIIKYRDKKPATRELCVECKEKWLSSEVDE